MDKRKIKAVMALALVLLIGIWVYAGAKKQTWNDLQDAMTFETGYGVMSAGPGLTLRAGKYRLDYEIYTDGENRLRLAADNAVGLDPDEVILEPEQAQGSLTFTVYNETENLQFLIDYESGTFLEVGRLSLTGRICSDTVMTASLMLLTVMALCWMRLKGKLSRHRLSLMLVMGFAAMIASTPCFKENLNIGDDMIFHLERLGNLTNGLLSGQFPVRVGAYMNRGFGGVTSVYYPELFLYIPAGMILLGTSIQYAMQVFLIGINLLTAAAMFACARRIFKSDWTGAAASVLYTLSIYRLTDVYTRSAVGEALAMAFMPLLALGLWEVFFGDRKKWALLAISAAAIYQSHMISTLIVAVTVAALSLAMVVRLVKEKRLGALMLAGLFAALLCVSAVVPLMTYNQSGVTAGMMVRWTADNAVSPSQLLFATTDPLTGAPADGTLKATAVEIGAPLLLAALAACWHALRTEKRGQEERAALAFVVLGAAFALAATTMFPWAKLDTLTHGLSGYIQFPWRLLMMTSFFFALAGGYGLTKLAEEKQALMLFAALGMCMVFAMPMLTTETKKDNYVAYSRVSSQNVAFQDYTLEGSYPSDTEDGSVHADGNVSFGRLHRAGTVATLDVDAQTDARVTLPLYAFAGYAADVDGQEMTIEIGEQNRMTILLPAGTRGTLRVRYVGVGYWRIADAVSLAALALLAGKKIRRKAGRTA